MAVMFKRRSDISRRSWWAPARVIVLALAVTALWWFVYHPLTAEGEWIRIEQDYGLCAIRSDRAVQGCVIDGDTLAIGFGEQARRIRFTGFDAPELDGACEAEQTRAIQARDFLHTWLNDAAFEWSGADQPPYDQYGRELREVRRKQSSNRHEYLAETMIGRDLAAPSGWGTTPRNWCE